MSKKGGYVIVDLKGQTITAGTPFTLDGVTARLDRAKNKACLLSGFAIGNEEKRDVFVDLQPTTDGYAGTVGGYQITIEDDEVTITDGGILLENIVDSQGHKRFIEGELTTETITGVTFTYAKWSLSGTHLMVVLAGNIANETTLAGGSFAISGDLPLWVANKVYPVVGNAIEYKNCDAYDSGYASQTLRFLFYKSSNQLKINLVSSITLSADRTFRVQFDLLIDNAE